MRPVKRIAVRCRKPDGQFAYGVLALYLVGPAGARVDWPAALRCSMIRQRCCWRTCTFYDQRGGGVETSFKGDKQGLGIGKRSKKRFAAQQMVMLLGTSGAQCDRLGSPLAGQPVACTTMGRCVWCAMSFISVAFCWSMLAGR